jgi:anti-sigma factor RsiW
MSRCRKAKGGVPPVEMIMTDRHERHEHLDEGTIHAWLDGALPPDESTRAEALAQSCAECAALVAEARGLIAASSRILSSLDAVPAGVIPGSAQQGDQLAALRARRNATTRHWWQDRRVMVAASLVFVAGVSSLVLRTSPEELVSPSAQRTAESVRDTPDSAPIRAAAPPSATPAPPAPTPSRGAREGDRKLERTSPVTDMAQTKVAVTPPTDTAAERKAVAENVAAPSAPAVANEARRSDVATVGRGAADSLVSQRDRAAVIQRPLRQEGTRQAVQQVAVDSLARAVSPSALGAGVQRRSIGAVGGAAAMADAAGPGGACYRLNGLTAPGIADTIRLLNEMAPVLSDPSWFRTRLYGALRDTTLAWRSIDGVTVELRSKFGSDTGAVRFTTDGTAAGDRSIPAVRFASAIRIACPR